MNLAAEAGDPTLVYRFMSLASNNAIWTNRAAFGHRHWNQRRCC
jgi:proteasome component ECM29